MLIIRRGTPISTSKRFPNQTSFMAEERSSVRKVLCATPDPSPSKAVSTSQPG